MLYVIGIEVACLEYTVLLGYTVYVSEYTVHGVCLLMHGLLCQICIHGLVICVSALVCIFAYMFVYALHLFVLLMSTYMYVSCCVCVCQSVHMFKKRQT